ncbi:MAG: hypothetical protein AAGA30_15390 [Planctomycetota bacterium]
MQFTIRSLLLIMLMVGIGFTVYHNTEYYKRWKRVKEFASTLDVQQSSYELSVDYRKLFDLAGADLTPWLSQHKIDSIAVQSSWESVELSVPIEVKKGTYKPSSTAIAEFLDLIESRRKIVIPKWWRQTVELAKANCRYNIFGGRPMPGPYHNSGLNFIRCPTDARLEKHSKDYLYISSDVRLTIPEKMMGDNVSAIRERKRDFAAFHEGFGFPHRVACFTSDSNDVVWESTACGSWWHGVSGVSVSNLSLVVAGDSVYVFGEAGRFYIHGFDLKTGQTTFQFSSNF